MSVKDDIHDQMMDKALEDHWHETIEQMVDDGDTHDELFEWIEHIRDDFLDFCDVVEDDEELRQALHDRYINLYSRWKLENTRMQYQAVNAGGPDPEVIVKGSLLTSVLERIENLIGGQITAQIEDFLTDPESYFEAERVPSGQLDEFMNYIGELTVTGEMYRHIQNSLANEDIPSETMQNIQSTNQKFNELSNELQQNLLTLREQSMENMLQEFPVIARNLTEQTDKDVEVNLSGTSETIDKQLIDPLSDILGELIRNAVEHGIEPSDERESKDKNATGTIEIEVTRQEKDVVITVRDDGRGIPTDELRKQLEEQPPTNLSDPEKISDDRIEDLITHPEVGLSGVEDSLGLHGVNNLIEQLRGTLSWNSTEDEGTEMIVTVPRNQSVIVIEGMHVSVAGQEFIVPMDCVLESLSLRKANITRIENKRDALRIRDDLYPLHSLRDVLDLPSQNSESEQDIAMVLEEQATQYSIKVDEIKGQQKVVVRDVDGLFNGLDYMTGFAVLGDGQICILLDVEGLIPEETVDQSLT